MARVMTTNADTYLDEYAPVFLDYRNKLVHAQYDVETGHWLQFVNGRYFCNFISRREGLCCHWELVRNLHDPYLNHEKREMDHISGRLHPNGSVIYVHDLDSRCHNPSLARRYKKRLDKVIDRVYKYMDHLLS